MDFNQLVEKLNKIQSLDEKAVLDEPYDSHRYGDQVQGDEEAKPIPGGVLSNRGDAKHPFQGRLVGADESQEPTIQAIEEDYITQLTQEFADFLQNREPVEEAPEEYGGEGQGMLGLKTPAAAPAAAASAVPSSVGAGQALTATGLAGSPAAIAPAATMPGVTAMAPTMQTNATGLAGVQGGPVFGQPPPPVVSNDTFNTPLLFDVDTVTVAVLLKLIVLPVIEDALF